MLTVGGISRFELRGTSYIDQPHWTNLQMSEKLTTRTHFLFCSYQIRFTKSGSTNDSSEAEQLMLHNWTELKEALQRSPFEESSGSIETENKRKG